MLSLHRDICVCFVGISRVGEAWPPVPGFPRRIAGRDTVVGFDLVRVELIAAMCALESTEAAPIGLAR